MRVVIAGGHGKIALILERLLSERGDSVTGLIRNPAQVGDLNNAGTEAIIVDLEKSSVDQVAAHVRGADAVLFAAGRDRVAERPGRKPLTATQRFCWRMPRRPPESADI